MEKSVCRNLGVAARAGRSEVRRWSVHSLEAVQHQHLGQEWVPHWHDEWSVGAIIEGQCWCSVAGKPLRAGPGDLIAVAPNTVHTGALESPEGNGRVLVVMMYVPLEWLQAQGLPIPNASGRVRASQLAQAAQALRTAAQARAWLSEALSVLAHGLRRQDAGRAPSAAAWKVLGCLQHDVLREHLTVAQLAQRCQISRERLHRVVRQWVGLGPAEYLRTLRLNRARQMLLLGETPIQVSLACGFADQAHFTRWYRRSFGYTPGDLANAVARETTT